MTTRSATIGFTLFLKRKVSTKLSLETRLANDPNDEQHAAHGEAEAGYRRALGNIEKRKNTFWCYLAMVLDTASLMLTKDKGWSQGMTVFARKVSKQRNRGSCQCLETTVPSLPEKR